MFSSGTKRLVWLTLLALLGMSAEPSMAAAKGEHYYSSEFGAAMTFPAGSRVCPALSGDHVHGFYAQYYAKAESCEETRSNHPDTSVSAMGVYANYNASFESAQTNYEDYCKLSGSTKPLRPAELRRLSIKGHHVRGCSTKTPDGRIEITVIASNGKWRDDDDSPVVPYIFYLVTLVTNAERGGRDLPMFETFLHSIRLYRRNPAR